jgi:molybdopterin molybdotransferase
MTGAALPRGADPVVMQEQVARKGDLARIEADLPANTHIRRAGEDVPEGAPVLSPGRRLDWPEIGLLAALGIAVVRVAAPVRIAILPTGAELRRAGTELAAGCIHDANGPMLAALLSGEGVKITVRPVDDDAAALAEALADAARCHDLVITTGGMASGLGDHVRAAVTAAGGRLDVAGVAMKPGKPLGLGRLAAAGFVGLPGNPQASAFAALAFVRPMIAVLAGAAAQASRTATLAFSCHGPAGRVELVPVQLASDEGRPVARRSGPPGSHRMMPMVGADAIAVVPGSAEAGTIVEILPFYRLQLR